MTVARKTGCKWDSVGWTHSNGISLVQTVLCGRVQHPSSPGLDNALKAIPMQDVTASRDVELLGAAVKKL